jgi:hypothetical protein
MEGGLNHQGSTRSNYRCHYIPLDRFGCPVPSESGLLPFVQLKANNAEHAHRVAFDKIRCPISHVERLDDAKPAARRVAS